MVGSSLMKEFLPLWCTPWAAKGNSLDLLLTAHTGTERIQFQTVGWITELTMAELRDAVSFLMNNQEVVLSLCIKSAFQSRIYWGLWLLLFLCFQECLLICYDMAMKALRMCDKGFRNGLKCDEITEKSRRMQTLAFPGEAFQLLHFLPVFSASVGLCIGS